MKKVLIALSVLIVLGAAGAGGWWYAADRGMIPGKPNSPRPENFKAALDAYLSQSAAFGQRPCVHASYSPPQGRGFPDMRFDWTPVGFRAVPDARMDSRGQVSARLEMLAKHGLLQSGKTAEGTAEYTMSWKGFAETNQSGCFFIASAEREAKIIGFEKKRVENNVDIYEVTARAQPLKVEAWAQSPEFKESFGATSSYARQIDPEPVTYELARGERGFSVIAERGRQPTARQAATGEDAAMNAKLAGTLTPERVKKAAESYLAKSGETRYTMCLRLPNVPGEADEVQPPPHAQMDAAKPPRLSYTFYNVVGRDRRAMDGPLRGYETMRRLESLGLARSELLNVGDFKGAPAQGGVRFELTEAFSAKLAAGYQPCYPTGALQADEVVSFTQFSASNLRPRFVVRMTVKEADEDAKRVIGKFGHLARVADVGTWMSGTLRYTGGELQVEHAQVHMPAFLPDTRELNLPVIQVTPARPGAPSVGSIGAAPAPGVGSMDVYALGVYEGALPGGGAQSPGRRAEGTVAVTVHRGSRPVALYLSAYEPVHWVLNVTPGTQLVRVVTSGYHQQRVTMVRATGVEVLRVPYTTVNSNTAQADLGAAAARQFGMQPVSAQYSYKGGIFEVGRR